MTILGRQLAAWVLATAVLLAPPMVSAAGPDVRLADMHGKQRNANEFIGQGKWTVVAVWASDCAVCNQEIHHMASFYAAHKDTDATVLGVSIDGHDRKQQALGFVQAHKLAFPNLLAELPQMQKFGGGPVMGTPTYFIYSPQGKLLAAQVGPITQEQAEKYIAKAALAQARTDARKKTPPGG